MPKDNAFVREDAAFDADGTTIRGWLYRPELKQGSKHGKVPLIVMAAGFACVKEMHLDKYARVFAAGGFAALAFDFRNLGMSDGSPRQELDPWRQIEDYRHAVTFATTLPFVDANRIGAWGISYSGGHVLALGATDRRVKCVVAGTPTISGGQSGFRRVPMDKVDGLTKAFAEDRIRRMKGEAPAMRPLIGAPEDNPIYPSNEVRDFFVESTRDCPSWKSEVTLRSLEFSRGYEPGIYIPAISPTPLLMIVGLKDYVTGTDLQLEAFRLAREPRKLVLMEGGHFAPYVVEFEKASRAALDWFKAHLWTGSRPTWGRLINS